MSKQIQIELFKHYKDSAWPFKVFISNLLYSHYDLKKKKLLCLISLNNICWL